MDDNTPPCFDEISTSSKAKNLHINELVANVYCALKDIAAAIRESLSLVRKNAIKEFDITQEEEDVWSCFVGKPFVLIGIKYPNEGMEPLEIQSVDTGLWKVFFVGNPTVESSKKLVVVML